MSLANITGIQEIDFMHMVHIADEVTADESALWVVIVDTIILALTLIGAFFILGRLSWGEFHRQAATTRVRIVESLIFTDVIMGIVGLVGCGLMLNNKPLVLDTSLCDGLGVLMVATFFSQHLWTLILAFATFMILIYPLHSITSWIEKYWYWTWPVVWGISFGVSVIGYVLYGYGPSGGICYYQNNSGLFAVLIQFLPRAIVFLCIACLYGKLYIFLRRPDKIRSGYSESASQTSLSKFRRGAWFRRSKQQQTSSNSGWFRRPNNTVLIDAAGHRVGGTSSASSAATKSDIGPPPLIISGKPSRTTKRNTVVDPDLPPWERVELPVFQVDGEVFGGSSASGAGEVQRWRDRVGGRRRATPTPSNAQSPLTSPTLVPTEPVTIPSVLDNSVSPTTAFFDRTANPSRSPTTAIFAGAPQLATVTEAEHAAERMTLASSDSSGETVASLTTTAVDSSPSAPQSPVTLRDNMWPSSGPSERGQSFSSVPGSDKALMSAPPPAHLPDGFDPTRRGSVPDGTLPFRRASGIPMPVGVVLPPGFSQSRTSRNGANGTIPGNIADLPRSTTPLDKDVDKYYEDDDDDDVDVEEKDDDEWDLFRMLKENPPEAGNDPFAVQTARSEQVEYVQESMASYLNRKTALLMLWFPLGYVLLFSVSLIRIIWDFAGQPPIELRAISRWMMFGQGLLDAIIYGLVEWHTKRVVRRRVRQGTFSPRGSNGPHSNQGFGQAIRNLGRSGNKRSAADGGTGSGLGSALGLGSKAAAQTDIEVQQTASMRSPTVSFVDPEKSMLQRLDISRPETKNSAASSATVVRASSQDERGPERTSQRRQVT